MTLLAVLRPDDWDFPLLVHVVGAGLLVGGLVTAVTVLLLGWRRDSAWHSRLGFWVLLLVAFPAWWIMRIGAEWIYSKENWDDVEEEPAWLGIGFITAELGGLLLLISIILTGIGMRRLRRPDTEKSVLVQIGGVLATLLLLAYTVAVWAMTAKPD
jgi:ABC-type enterobactin transport system permease subunit